MPFSQGELDGAHEDFLDVVFTDPTSLTVPRRPGTEREEYEQRVCRGGMPLAIYVDDRKRANFCRSYLDASLKRDVLDSRGFARSTRCHGSWTNLPRRPAKFSTSSRRPMVSVSNPDLATTTSAYSKPCS